MRPPYKLLILFSLVFTVFIVPHVAYAQVGAGVMNDVMSKFQAATQTWGSAFTSAGTRLFWALVPISMVWRFGTKAAQGNGNATEILAEFVRFTIFVGFYFWLLKNGVNIAQDIMSSMRQLAGTASGLNSTLHPSEIVNVGFHTMGTLLGNLKNLGWKQIPEGLCLIVTGIVFLLICGLVAVNMLLAIIGMWILMYAGVFMLGFGGASWTSEMAISYFRSVFSGALRVAGMILVVGISTSILNTYSASVPTTGASIGDCGAILLIAIVMYMLSDKVPEQLAGLPHGSTGSGAAVSGGQALAGAAAATAMLAQSMKMAASAATGVGGAVTAVQEAVTAAQNTIADDAALSGGGGNNEAGDISDVMGGGSSGSPADDEQFDGDGVSGGTDADDADSSQDGTEAEDIAEGGATQGAQEGGAQAEQGAQDGTAQTAQGSGQGAAQDEPAQTAPEQGGQNRSGSKAGLASVASLAAGNLASAAAGMAKDATNARLSQTTGGRLASRIASDNMASRMDTASTYATESAANGGASAPVAAAAGRAAAATIKAGGSMSEAMSAAKDAVSQAASGVDPASIATGEGGSPNASGSSGQSSSPKPWMHQTGGFDSLSPSDQAQAQENYDAWKQEDGHIFSLGEYVQYAQQQHQARTGNLTEADHDEIERLSRGAA